MAEKKRVPLKEGLFHEPASPGDRPYLIGTKCAACGYVAFPRAIVCPSCMKEETMQEVQLSRSGRLDTFTVLRQAPSGFTAPYGVGTVTLPEGVKIFTQIAGIEPKDDALKIGQEMELVIEKVREDANGNEIIAWKFKPV